MNSTAFPSVVSPAMSSGGSPKRQFGALASGSAPPPRTQNGQPSAVEAHALALALADFIGRIRTAPGTNQKQLADGELYLRIGFMAIIGSAQRPAQPAQIQPGPLAQAAK